MIIGSPPSPGRRRWPGPAAARPCRASHVEHRQVVRLAPPRGACRSRSRAAPRSRSRSGRDAPRRRAAPRGSSRLVALSSTTSTRSPVSRSAAPSAAADGGRLPSGQRQLEPEGAAARRLAVQADLAAHHLHQLPADGQTQPGAAVPPGGRGVGLGEGLEQPVLVGLGDADAGVGDLEAQHDLGRRPAGDEIDPDRHLALGGELDRVGGQVEQHLPDPAGVAAHAPSGRPGSSRPAARGPWRTPPARAGRRPPRPAWRRSKSIDVELDLAGLELGEVQDVVDDVQQRLAGAADALGVLALLRRRASVSSSRPVSPITPFIGVRISWLIVARNSDLSREDSSASSRACSSVCGGAAALGDVLPEDRDHRRRAPPSRIGETVSATGTTAAVGRVQSTSYPSSASPSGRDQQGGEPLLAAGREERRGPGRSPRGPVPVQASAAGFQADDHAVQGEHRRSRRWRR